MTHSPIALTYCFFSAQKCRPPSKALIRPMFHTLQSQISLLGSVSSHKVPPLFTSRNLISFVVPAKDLSTRRSLNREWRNRWTSEHRREDTALNVRNLAAAGNATLAMVVAAILVLPVEDAIREDVATGQESFTAKLLSLMMTVKQTHHFHSRTMVVLTRRRVVVNYGWLIGNLLNGDHWQICVLSMNKSMT